MLNNRVNKVVYIYSLENPLTNDIRYIGKTVNLKRRLKGHLDEAKELNSKITYKVSWIRSLLKQGIVPVLNIIDEVKENEWEFWEKHYISLYRSWGFKLTNGTEGGDGNMCWQKHHKEETKRKISEAHKGKHKTKEHKKNLGLARSNPVISINVRTGEQIEYASLKEAAFLNNTCIPTLNHYMKTKTPYNDLEYTLKFKRRIVNYPKQRVQGVRINKKIYQIDFNKKVIGIWNNASDIMVNVFNKSTGDTSLIHSVCRSKGKQTYHNYFWIYETDLNNSYIIGDYINEINLQTKNKEILLYEGYVPKFSFKSISEAARYFKTSDVTIGNYLKSQKLFNGLYLIKEKPTFNKRKLGYREIIYSKEQLLSYSNEKLKEIVEEFYDMVKGTEFPYHETKENLNEILKQINKFDFNILLKENIFNNMTSARGVSYLKSIFKNYYHCKYKDGLTPIEIWFNEKTLKEVIRYRVGLNNSRETFNLCLHQVIRGISARRSTISFFKPIVAAAIYKYFLKGKENPIVIDPCAGFGGRLLGFKSIYPNGTYIGIEPQKETYNNLLKLASQLPGEIKLYNCKLEEYKESKVCDLTFTSIPYFDKEEYNNEFNYQSFEEWKDSFIKELLTYQNLLINLPIELQEQLNLKYKELYYLKNGTSHFNKSVSEKKEYILQL